MDRDGEYRAIVRRVLQEYRDDFTPIETVHTEFVCDDQSGHYHIG